MHDLAEQLEHIVSDDLIERLETFLGFPSVDPHGDPIPDENGKVEKIKTQPSAPLKKKVTFINDANSTNEFLKYLDKSGLTIGDKLEVSEIEEFDKSVTVLNKKIQSALAMKLQVIFWLQFNFLYSNCI